MERTVNTHSYYLNFAAKAVVLTLKQIAASGRTVICTIHQPRTDIWHVFDNVVLLVTGGGAAYSGRADRVIEYFAEAGHIVPAFTSVPGTAQDILDLEPHVFVHEDYHKLT